jgi:hypothetical protein
MRALTYRYADREAVWRRQITQKRLSVLTVTIHKEHLTLEFSVILILHTWQLHFVLLFADATNKIIPNLRQFAGNIVIFHNRQMHAPTSIIFYALHLIIVIYSSSEASKIIQVTYTTSKFPWSWNYSE